MNHESSLSFRLAWVALVAGLAAAVVEMVFVLPIQAMLGASPLTVFQSIAAGFFGKSAFHLGLYAAMIGVLVHVLVSLIAAAAFVTASQRWPVLLRRPVISGVGYGFLAYLVMNFVVIPMSAIGFHSPKFGLLWVISVAVHLFAFGLPIAIVARALLTDGSTTAASASKLASI